MTIRPDIRGLLGRWRKRHGFRVVYSWAHPLLKKLGILSFLKSFDRQGGGDPWSYNKDSENFRALFETYSIDPRSLVRPSRDYLFGYLLSPNPEDLTNIAEASAALGLRYRIYDIHDPGLFDALRESPCDGLFIRPALENNLLRGLFHEAVEVLTSWPGLRIYPTPLELGLYEAKRTLAGFFRVHDIPHPDTRVFYDYEAAAAFIEGAALPLVFKTHVGSSANGVEILRTRRQALRLARRLFRSSYLKKNEVDRRCRDWGYVFLQEYIENVREHRIHKIGDSWFGYQKWKTPAQDFMSGSGHEIHGDPPPGLLDFCHDLAVRFGFTTMSFDVFQNPRGEFLVNELQTWFGSYNPSQMYIDGVPGRYRRTGGGWVFEPGLYNVHGSMLLRIADFVRILESGGPS